MTAIVFSITRALGLLAAPLATTAQQVQKILPIGGLSRQAPLPAGAWKPCGRACAPRFRR